MRLCGKLIRSLAVCGLATAALLYCGLPAHAQSRIGGGSTGSSSMGSSGFGGSGGSGASGGSGGGSSGFGNNSSGQFSFAGGSTSGSFAGSTSSTFSGGSTSGSFSGTSGSAFSGTSGSGSYGSGSGSGGMSITGGVSNMNFLASSYQNPLAGGLSTSNGTASTTYGTALYGTLLSNPTKIVGSASGSSGGFIGSSGSSGGMRGSMSGGVGMSGSSGSNTGTGQYGIFALPYAVAVNQRYPIPPGTPTPPQPGTTIGPVVGPGGVPAAAALTKLPARMQTDLMGLIGRSDNVSAATRNGITLGYDAGGTVVLRGTIASPAEAHAIESILRFAPGITGVRNEMTLKGP